MARVQTNKAVQRELWENELELDIDDVLRRAESPREVEAWIASRSGRQLSVLCRALGIADATGFNAKRAAVAGCDGKLVPFYLADRFAVRKGQFAVIDLAESVLAPDVLALCRPKDEEAYDTRALVYALLHDDPTNLRTLFHLDKIHKSGFARMALTKKIRQPKGKTFEEFLKRDQAEQVLVEFDKAKRDGRPSQLKNIVRHHHHHLVYIRRPERPQHIIREGKIQHGHRAEWIILDFADNARRVNIASHSNEASIQIANALASAYFGKDVEYDNECEITYEQQIHVLLDALKAGACEGLRLFELDVRSSPVDGADLRIGHADPDVARRAIASLERDHASLTADVDRIAKVKLLYEEKRIEVQFEELDSQGGGEGGEYVARYMDHRLNASLRKRFEDFMRDTHGIPILSTEKRFARRS